MIGIDTNVLLRYIVRDNSIQVEQTEVFLSSCSEENPGFINSIVLAELVWVLERSYKYSRSQILPVLEKLLATHELNIEHEDAVQLALDSYLHSKAGFVDLFIGYINRVYGCPYTKTFDQDAAESIGFEII